MLREYYRRALRALGYKTERRYISEAIERIESSWGEKNLFVIEAPTGYGKTTITASLALLTGEEAGKLIVAYPLRTLLEDQYSKLRNVVDEQRLGKRYMHEESSPYLIKPITLTTVDTLSLTMFGLAPEDLNVVVRGWEEDRFVNTSRGHYLFSWSSVMMSDIVLDEVHLVAEESKSLTFLTAMLEHIISHDQRVVFMTATMPTRFKELILDSLRRFRDRVEWMEFRGSAEEDEYIASRLEKKPEIHIRRLGSDAKFDTIRGWLDDALERGLRRVLIVFNTVGEAVSFYRNLEGYENRLLIHSRFTEGDRLRKHEELQRLKSGGDYIIVATQVVEAGLDLSSNALITDLAPMCSTIQRFGRLLRYEGEREGVAYVWYESDLGGDRQIYKVYDRGLCAATLDALREAERGNVSLHVPSGERGYKLLLDRVYQDADLRINYQKIDKMLSVFTNLGDISKAVDLFFEMEGSFVRESALVPVRCPEMKDEVSVEMRVFERLLKEGLVKGQIVENGEKGIHECLPSWLSEGSTTLQGSLTRKIIKHIHNAGVKAFIVEGSYNSEYGLELGVRVDGA